MLSTEAFHSQMMALDTNFESNKVSEFCSKHKKQIAIAVGGVALAVLATCVVLLANSSGLGGALHLTAGNIAVLGSAVGVSGIVMTMVAKKFFGWHKETKQRLAEEEARQTREEQLEALVENIDREMSQKLESEVISSHRGFYLEEMSVEEMSLALDVEIDGGVQKQLMNTAQKLRDDHSERNFIVKQFDVQNPYNEGSVRMRAIIVRGVDRCWCSKLYSMDNKAELLQLQTDLQANGFKAVFSKSGTLSSTIG